MNLQRAEGSSPFTEMGDQSQTRAFEEAPEHNTGPLSSPVCVWIVETLNQSAYRQIYSLGSHFGKTS